MRADFLLGTVVGAWEGRVDVLLDEACRDGSDLHGRCPPGFGLSLSPGEVIVVLPVSALAVQSPSRQNSGSIRQASLNAQTEVIQQQVGRPSTSETSLQPSLGAAAACSGEVQKRPAPVPVSIASLTGAAAVGSSTAGAAPKQGAPVPISIATLTAATGPLPMSPAATSPHTPTVGQASKVASPIAASPRTATATPVAASVGTSPLAQVYQSTLHEGARGNTGGRGNGSGGRRGHSSPGHSPIARAYTDAESGAQESGRGGHGGRGGRGGQHTRRGRGDSERR
jgi:hypothetical protein